jgi:hypothetical protein
LWNISTFLIAFFMKHKLLLPSLVMLAAFQTGFAQLNFSTVNHSALQPTWATYFRTSYLMDGKFYCIGSNGTYSSYNNSVWTKSQISGGGDNRGIALDHQSVLWIGTFGDGLFKRENNTWTNLTTTNSQLPSNDIRAVKYDTLLQNVWVGTYAGLLRIHGTEWKVFNTANSQLTSDVATEIEQAADGSVWIVNKTCVIRIQGETWTRFNASQIFGGTDGELADLFIDADQKVWVTSGYGKQGVAYYNGSAWSIVPGFDGLHIQSVGVDDQGTALLGELFKGMHAVYNGVNYFFPTAPNGFPANQNFDFTLDKNGNTLWLCNTWGLWEIKNILVGVNDPESLEQLSIFPVPAREEVQIRSEESTIRMVTIVSSNGQKAGEFSFDGATNVTIPVAQLPQGVYFMQTTLDNNQMQILKVMVNH